MCGEGVVYKRNLMNIHHKPVPEKLKDVNCTQNLSPQPLVSYLTLSDIKRIKNKCGKKYRRNDTTDILYILPVLGGSRRGAGGGEFWVRPIFVEQEMGGGG